MTSDVGFKIVSCVTPRHDIPITFKVGELLDGHCSFSIICAVLTVSGIVERHVQYAQNPMHLVESGLAAVG